MNDTDAMDKKCIVPVKSILNDLREITHWGLFYIISSLVLWN